MLSRNWDTLIFPGYPTFMKSDFTHHTSATCKLLFSSAQKYNHSQWYSVQCFWVNSPSSAMGHHDFPSGTVSVTVAPSCLKGARTWSLWCAILVFQHFELSLINSHIFFLIVWPMWIYMAIDLVSLSINGKIIVLTIVLIVPKGYYKSPMRS